LVHGIGRSYRRQCRIAVNCRRERTQERLSCSKITITRKEGSFTLEECMAQLVRKGLLGLEDARARAVHREELDKLVR